MGRCPRPLELRVRITDQRGCAHLRLWGGAAWACQRHWRKDQAGATCPVRLWGRTRPGLEDSSV